MFGVANGEDHCQRIGLMRSFDLAEFQGTLEHWFEGAQVRVMDIV